MGKRRVTRSSECAGCSRLAQRMVSVGDGGCSSRDREEGEEDERDCNEGHELFSNGSNGTVVLQTGLEVLLAAATLWRRDGAQQRPAGDRIGVATTHGCDNVQAGDLGIDREQGEDEESDEQERVNQGIDSKEGECANIGWDGGSCAKSGIAEDMGVCEAEENALAPEAPLEGSVSGGNFHWEGR